MNCFAGNFIPSDPTRPWPVGGGPRRPSMASDSTWTPHPLFWNQENLNNYILVQIIVSLFVCFQNPLPGDYDEKLFELAKKKMIEVLISIHSGKMLKLIIEKDNYKKSAGSRLRGSLYSKEERRTNMWNKKFDTEGCWSIF